MTDLGTLGGRMSFAYAINNQGQIVGASYTASGSEHACLWSP
jgi:probable HAF family extracellular repeat protein